MQQHEGGNPYQSVTTKAEETPNLCVPLLAQLLEPLVSLLLLDLQLLHALLGLLALLLLRRFALSLLLGGRLRLGLLLNGVAGFLLFGLLLQARQRLLALLLSSVLGFLGGFGFGRSVRLGLGIGLGFRPGVSLSLGLGLCGFGGLSSLCVCVSLGFRCLGSSAG